MFQGSTICDGIYNIANCDDLVRFKLRIWTKYSIVCFNSQSTTMKNSEYDHNHKLKTTSWYREEKPHNNHETPERQTKHCGREAKRTNSYGPQENATLAQ